MLGSEPADDSGQSLTWLALQWDPIKALAIFV